jgi:hypothetical protein
MECTVVKRASRSTTHAHVCVRACLNKNDSCSVNDMQYPAHNADETASNPFGTRRALKSITVQPDEVTKWSMERTAAAEAGERHKNNSHASREHRERVFRVLF